LDVFVLPDGYKVDDQSLEDILRVVKPTYDPSNLYTNVKSFDLTGKQFIPGYIGLNNIKSNEYANVIVHALSQVKPIREYFLLQKEPVLCSELVKRFGVLLRRIWNPNAFKNHCSPHEFIQQCSSDSKKKFGFRMQADAHEYLSWLLNSLHAGLGGSKTKPTIFQESFQGQLFVDEQQTQISMETLAEELEFVETRSYETKVMPFWFLSLDLPPQPLFAIDSDEIINGTQQTAIPQIPLIDLLEKYTGHCTFKKNNSLTRYNVKAAPKFMILTIKRFSKNNFVEERNRTIVTFPLNGLEACT
jgi:U4/U6.U5 tri-snRNP-associated protein 2